MFEDYMNHTCNIIHLEEGTVEVGYGINAEDVPRAEKEPAEKEIPCHFHLKTSNYLKVIQNEPYSSVDGEVKLSLPAGTDIRKNDIVEDCRSGLRFRAGVPKEVYGGHHIIVTVTRMEGVKAAI